MCLIRVGAKFCRTVAMFPSPCFNAHFEVSHQKCVMEMPNLETSPLIHQNVFFTLTWVGFWKRVNANNGRSKCICQTNLSMRKKKSCDFVLWYGKTWLTSGTISFHSIWNVMVIMICTSKVCRQSISVLLPPRIVIRPCSPTTFIVFRLFTLRHKSFIKYENYYIQWLFVIFSGSLSGIGMGIFQKCCIRIFGLIKKQILEYLFI